MNLDLGCVDVVQFLNSLGVERVSAGLTEAKFSCPMSAHSYGDKNPSAYMNLHTTAWMCHSCGQKGTAISFLAEVKGVSYATAKQWIAEKWAPHYADIENLYEFILKGFENGVKDFAALEKPVVVLDEVTMNGRRVNWKGVAELDGAPPSLKYLLNRGFTPEILTRFECSFDVITDRPCITVRDADGGLIGFKGRAWNEDQWPRYMIIGDTERSIENFGQRYGFAPYDAAKAVFGIHLVPAQDHWVICEGELNVIAMHQMGFTNTVGPSGSNLSDRFVEQVVSHCNVVTLLFDSDLKTDISAATAKIKLLTAIEQFDRQVEVRVCADHEGDPNEMSADEIYKLINTAQNSTLYRVEHLLDKRL